MLAHEHAGVESLKGLVEDAQRPNYTFNLKTGLGGEGFDGVPGLESQPPSAELFKASRDWGMQVTVGQELIRWDMFLDTERLDQDSVALICERFPLLLRRCQTVESRDGVALGDVVDLARL
jgi:hypothetical protein